MPLNIEQEQGLPATGQRVVAQRAGGPEVLALEDFALPGLGPGQLLVEVAAAGVNFIDTYLRSGTYRMDYPGPMGFEGAGTVVGLGSGDTLVLPQKTPWLGWPRMLPMPPTF